MIEINTGVVDGIEGYGIKVEVEVLNGLPAFIVIGQGDSIIREAGERIKSAIVESGFRFPKGKVVCNLSPAQIKKKGSQIELAIAIAILAETGQVDRTILSDTAFFGELTLSGKLVPCPGLIPIANALRSNGVENLIIANGIREPFELVSQKKYIASSLAEVVEVINAGVIEDNSAKFAGLCGFEAPPAHLLDFDQVRGQAEAKRAITVASAGCHGMMMVGSPGAGKTMLAKRIPTILPPLTKEEMNQVWSIYSAAGKDFGSLYTRPFRDPYYKITTTGLIGGGTSPMPGEITLAHRGVLFLDEMGEYQGGVLDALRTPLEEKQINLIRNGRNYTFPADFQLVGAANPCKCGNFGSNVKECTCTAYDIRQHKKKLTGPIANRIHIHVYVPNISYEDYKEEKSISSAEMARSVIKALEAQEERFRPYPISRNSQLDGALLRKFCPLNATCERYLKLAYENMNLNPRSSTNLLKVARTIADIEGLENIDSAALLEAISYVDLDRIYGSDIY